TSRFGPDAVGWLASIPAGTARLAATWGFVPGTEAGDLPPESLPQQWGELLAALHSVPAHWPFDLRGRCDEAFARIGRRLSEPVIAARISPATWQRAMQHKRSGARVRRKNRKG